MSLNTNKKIAVIGLLLGGSFSAQAAFVAGAGSYEETAWVGGGAQTHIATAPNVVDRVFNSSYNNQEYSSVTLSNTPLPYVRASSSYNYFSAGGAAGVDHAGAGGSIDYGFTVSGTANTYVPVNIVSAFAITGYVYSDIVVNSVADAVQSYVTLQVNGLGVFERLGFDSLNNSSSYFHLSDTDAVIFPTAVNVSYQSTPSSAYGFDGYYFSLTGTITTSAMYYIDVDGSDRLSNVYIDAVSMSNLNAQTGGLAQVDAYIDPYISIDAGYLAANPNARITLGAGIGNAPVGTSSVPVPAAAWLFASALMGFVSLTRRRAV